MNIASFAYCGTCLRLNIAGARCVCTCSCDHPWFMHGPEEPGCVKCSCLNLCPVKETA